MAFTRRHDLVWDAHGTYEVKMALTYRTCSVQQSVALNPYPFTC